MRIGAPIPLYNRPALRHTISLVFQLYNRPRLILPFVGNDLPKTINHAIVLLTSS